MVWIGALTGAGYGSIKVDGKAQAAHRVAWFLVFGRWPKRELMHTCDNPACILLEHLVDGTHADNMHDRDRKGRVAHGTRQHLAKLSPRDVRAIRRERAGGATYKTIAGRYGVARTTISHVCRGNTWRRVWH